MRGDFSGRSRTIRPPWSLPGGWAFEEPDHWLRFDEIERVVGAFAELGVSRIRLTGGEPLLRQGISDDGLKEAIIEALMLKPERHEFNEKREQPVRFMSMTGG
jgi:molybdenum cofactor biosynthesis enzyme MoaA